MRTRMRNVRVALPGLVAAGAAPATVASAGIPQHNGGDMDADDNAGPSDGDGNL